MKKQFSTSVGSKYTKIQMIQQNLTWPLSNKDIPVPEVVHVLGI